MNLINIVDVFIERANPFLLVIVFIKLVEYGIDLGLFMVDTIVDKFFFIEVSVSIWDNLICEVTSLFLLLLLGILANTLFSIQINEFLGFLSCQKEYAIYHLLVWYLHVGVQFEERSVAGSDKFL